MFRTILLILKKVLLQFLKFSFLWLDIAAKKTKYVDSDDSDEKFSSDDEENMKINAGAGIDDDSDFDVATVNKSAAERERYILKHCCSLIMLRRMDLG